MDREGARGIRGAAALAAPAAAALYRGLLRPRDRVVRAHPHAGRRPTGLARRDRSRAQARRLPDRLRARLLEDAETAYGRRLVRDRSKARLAHEHLSHG